MAHTRAAAVLWIEPAAPAKPPVGQPCNGCGLCCAWQPCPLGMVVSRRRHGACAALRWQPETRQYRCTVLADPRQLWPRLPQPAVRWVQRAARRWIAAGTACDFDAEADAAQAPTPSDMPTSTPPAGPSG